MVGVEASQIVDVSLILFAGFILALLVLQLFLAFFVLERGGGTSAARFLAAYLMLQIFSWGPPIAAMRIQSPDFVFRGFVAELGLGTGLGHLALAQGILAFLPFILIGFALSYPTPYSSFKSRRLIMLIFFGISTILAIASLLIFPYELTSSTDFYIAYSELSTFRFVAALTYTHLAASALGSAIIFRIRSRTATTKLAAYRYRYMSRWIIIPTLIGITIVAVFGFVGMITLTSTWASIMFMIFVMVVISMFAIIPPCALAYGLLRYRILDLEQKFRLGLRFTVRSTVLLLVFMSVFFLIAHFTGMVVTAQTQSTVLGMVGAFLVTFLLHPVQDAASRVAKRAVPPENQTENERRHLLYRATYEDTSADGVITEKERRTLESLARVLELGPDDIKHIEQSVITERSQGYAKIKIRPSVDVV